jgi:hypothetical protein
VTMSLAHLIETELMSVQQQEQQKQQQEVHSTTAQSEATTVTSAATPQHHQEIPERNEEAATAEVAVYSRDPQQKDGFDTANIADVTSWSEPVATTASSLPSPMTDIASRGATASGVTTGSGDGRTSILERALSEIFPGEEESTEDGTAAANGNRAPSEATNGNRVPSEATNGSRDGGEAAVIAETLSFTSDTSPWVQGGAFQPLKYFENILIHSSYPCRTYCTAAQSLFNRSYNSTIWTKKSNVFFHCLKYSWAQNKHQFSESNRNFLW